jgi:hypothetical protein
MDVIAATAVLAPLVLLLLLTLAITVHFFWLAHQGRWPPDAAGGERGPGSARTGRLEPKAARR